MRTSKAGARINRGRATSGSALNAGGFTLLELAVVVALLGAVLLIAFPRIPFLNDFTLNSEARRLAGLLRHLDETSTARKVYYRVWLRPEKGSVEVESSLDGAEFKKTGDPSSRGFTLKSGTEMRDIYVQGLGQVADGEVAVVFNPGMGAEPFKVHLRSGSRELTLSYNPYSGRVRVAEGYV